MKAKILSEPIDKMSAEMLILTVFKDERPLKGANGLVDWRRCGRISKIIMDGTFSGKFKEVTLVISEKKTRIPRILLVGLGDSDDFNEDRLNKVSHFIANKLKKLNVKKVSLSLPGSSYFPQNYTNSAEIMIRAFADSYEKNGNLFEMVIFETGRRIKMVCEGAQHAKNILQHNLLLSIDV